MKKFILPFMAIVLAIPLIVQAADFRTAQSGTVRVGPNEQLSNPYLAGNTITVDAPINGDLVAAGNTININNTIRQSLIAAAGNLNLSGTVQQNARILAGTLVVNSTVQQDLVAASGSIDISDQAVINSDVIAAGGSIIINGNVGGDLRVAADTLIINGIVGGNITADVGSLEIGDQAVINGNIKYRSDKEATIADGAQIQGNVEFEQRPSATEQRIRKFFAIGTLLSLISSFLLLLLLAYLLPRLTRQVIDNAYNDAGSSLVTQLGLGLATLIVTPFVILLLMISFIGARIGWVLLLAYALLLTLAASYSVILLGVALWKLFKKEVASPVSWTLLVIALIVAVILNFIPVLGWLILFIFFSIALGSLATITYNAIVKYRK